MIVSLKAIEQTVALIGGSVVAVVLGVAFCVNTCVGPTVLP